MKNKVKINVPNSFRGNIKTDREIFIFFSRVIHSNFNHELNSSSTLSIIFSFVVYFLSFDSAVIIYVRKKKKLELKE